MRKYLSPVLFLALFFVLFALFSCSGGDEPDDNSSSSRNLSSSYVGNSSSSSNINGSSSSVNEDSSSSGEEGSSSSNGEEDSSSSEVTGDSSSSSEGTQGSLDDLGLPDVTVIRFNNGGEPEIVKHGDAQVTKNGEHVVINFTSPDKEYNIVVSGTTSNGSLKIYSEYRIGLYLNGVNITNPRGSAINMQNGKRMSVNLVNSTNNYLADGAIYDEPSVGEKEKGTFFSEEKLVFSGGGSLEVKAKYNHAIVVDNDITIESGRITVTEAKNDGIHANDKIKIEGGTININSTGDAIQSERANVEISGGSIDAKTTDIKSHGISSEVGLMVISGSANIKLETSGNGAKGIKSNGFLAIDGGTINIITNGTIYQNDATNDENSATGIKVNNSMEINAGTLTIETKGKDSKGINVEGDLQIKGGNVTVTSKDDNAIKTTGNLTITGGTVRANSPKTKVINCNGSVCNENQITINGGTGGGF